MPPPEHVRHSKFAHMKRWEILFALLIAATSGTYLMGRAQQPADGTVEGSVLNEHGQTVANAKVLLIDDRPLGGRIPEVLSNAQGYFEFRSLKLGKYALSACKEDDDVPCYPGFNAANLRQFLLTSQNPSAMVTVQLGEKAGVIYGTVRDSISGDPLPAIFMLRLSQYPDKYQQTSSPSAFRIFVPGRTDYVLEVSARGYKTWSTTAPLHLNPGIHRRIDIPLDRLP
jgi:hypothetical protein